MTAPLIIRRLRLIGPAGDIAFEFKKRVTVITGPVASGKTSLLEMIKYAFGGNAIRTKAVREHVSAVEILMRIGDERYTLERPIGVGREAVTVTPLQGRPQMLPVSAEAGDRTLSEFLLDRLGIPQLRFPVSGRKPDEELTTVSFYDIYGLMYLDQEQIDGAIGYEGPRQQKWRQTFEVVYGLADPELARLQTELGQANADISRVANYISQVTRFLEATGFDALASASDGAERLRAELAELDRQIERARATSRKAERLPAAGDDASRELERELDEIRMELARAVAGSEALNRVRAQLRADVDHVERARSATTMLRELDFELCPRCLQELDADVPAAACRLCRQTEPEEDQGLAAELESRRLERQLSETSDLLEANVTRARGLEERLAATTARLQQARSERDRRAREAVAPFIEELTALSQRRGATMRATQEAERRGRLRAELGDANAEHERLRAEQQRLSRAIETTRADMEQGRESLRALSEAYSELIMSIEMPWAESASIDPKRYIPLIDGEPVRTLSSGGLKTMANFGFYLAQLQVNLRGYPIRLPPLMLIDSPRKNFGANPDDAESMRRFYRALYALTAQRTGTDFQVIVADNDTPSEERDAFSLVELDRDHPLVIATELEGDDSG